MRIANCAHKNQNIVWITDANTGLEPSKRCFVSGASSGRNADGRASANETAINGSPSMAPYVQMRHS